MPSRDQLVRELVRFFTFPAGRPSEVDLDLIVADVTATTGQADVERIVLARIPHTRVHRYDGRTFQDLSVLLALIRAHAQSKK